MGNVTTMRNAGSRVRFGTICVAVLLLLASACSKKGNAEQVVVEIPANFTGNFLIEMGVKNSPALTKEGDAYVVKVTGDGKVSTSTLLVNPQVTFRNASTGGVWGLSSRTSTTGDGIVVSGEIQFFVGTRKDFDAEQNKKNHSKGFVTGADRGSTRA